MKKKTLFMLVLVTIIVVSFGVYMNHTSAPVIYKSSPTVPLSEALISEKGIANAIVLENLKKGDLLSSPFTLKGKAKGWYFEGSFPIEIKNNKGVSVFKGIAEAQGNWMSGEYVPFETKINFSLQVPGSLGSIILKKDNPSGLLENEDSVTLPIVFK